MMGATQVSELVGPSCNHLEPRDPPGRHNLSKSSGGRRIVQVEAVDVGAPGSIDAVLNVIRSGSTVIRGAERGRGHVRSNVSGVDGDLVNEEVSVPASRTTKVVEAIHGGKCVAGRRSYNIAYVDGYGGEGLNRHFLAPDFIIRPERQSDGTRVLRVRIVENQGCVAFRKLVGSDGD